MCWLEVEEWKNIREVWDLTTALASGRRPLVPKPPVWGLFPVIVTHESYAVILSPEFNRPTPKCYKFLDSL